MFISRKKLKYLEKRFADLELQVQGQQKFDISVVMSAMNEAVKMNGKSAFAV